MEIQAYQLAVFSGWALLALVAWKAKKTSVRVAAVALMFVLFALNPFKHSQEGMASKERSVQRFEKIPNKVIVSGPEFSERQRIEMATLKNDSKGMKNEIHN